MITPKLDKFNQLIMDSQPGLAVCILGNPQTSDFEVVGLNPGPVPDDIREMVRARGIYFIGTIGLIHGAPKIVLDEALDSHAISIIHDVYVQHVETVANATLQHASLERLHSLPDPRRF
jgi:hypothetical protein